jgi:DNA-binding CsgD family transcriptional regulator
MLVRHAEHRVVTERGAMGSVPGMDGKGGFREARAREPLLNERQRTVLALIAEGKTNPQIADALGMTLDGAKWNVSEILGKLGLASREEAAAYYRWRRSLPARVRSAPAAFLAAKWLPWLGAAGGAVVVAIVAVVTIDLLRGSDDAPAGHATQVEAFMVKWDPGPDDEFMTQDDDPGRQQALGTMPLSELLALAERELQRPIPPPPETFGVDGTLREAAVSVRNPGGDGRPILPEVQFLWRDPADELAATLMFVPDPIQSPDEGEAFDAGPAFSSARWETGASNDAVWMRVSLTDHTAYWFFTIRLGGDGDDDNVVAAAREAAVAAALAMQPAP